MLLSLLALLLFVQEPEPAAGPAPAAPGVAQAVPDGASVVLELGDGRRVVGTAVKETEEHVFVDVGYTILAVPRKEVLRVRGAEESSAQAGAGGRREREVYVEGAAPEASVRGNVGRVAEGVVLVKVPGALGSGFVTHSSGWVVTNAHVVQDEQEITVTVFRRSADGLDKLVFTDVEIVALNPYWDLALLRIPADQLGTVALKAVPLGQPHAVRAGEPVFAVGNPLGLERSISEGIVSIPDRAHEGMLYVQTTTAINPGNSGGPLFNLRGEVIGVTTWGYLFSEGLNFAIPASTLRTFLDHRDAFAFDKDQPNTGYRYLAPPRKGAKVE